MTDHTEMQIPSDILEAATECYKGLLTTCERWDDEDAADDIPAIARAILAERERCAKVCGNFLILNSNLDVLKIVECEESIRGGKI